MQKLKNPFQVPRLPQLPQTSAQLDKIKTGLVLTAGYLVAHKKSPDAAFGKLFHDVQHGRVFADGKVFVDLVPNKSIQSIKRAYALSHKDPDFDVQAFVNRHFYELKSNVHHTTYEPDKTTTPREHVRNLWRVLERRNRRDRGSLLMLPYKYIVPGGRFQEQFYWDTYFVMLGLAADGEWKLIEGMIKNYVFMLRRYGCIPTANRSYFTSRSQPPFFSHMIELLASHAGYAKVYREYLPALVMEYKFWVKKRIYLRSHPENEAYARVVRMPEGEMLGRYYDNRQTPRPEMAGDDVEAAAASTTKNDTKLFLDLRAGAESGWDFSSRWLHDANNLSTICTTDIVPVDLNSLLYHLEKTIARAYRAGGQAASANKFDSRARKRAEAISKYMWNEKQGFFHDYNFRTREQTTSLTLAAAFPLYVGCASNDQAVAVARMLEKKFLRPGGLTTTLVDSGQQWDEPNGWAPLQWVAIVGLEQYGFVELAAKIRDAWLKNVEAVFKKEHKMIEKYDVSHVGGLGGGGEYPLQDGFGWTNGVYAVFKDRQVAG